MLKTFPLAKWGLAVLLVSSLSSCEDILEQYFPKPNPTPPTFPSLGLDIPFYTLSGGTRLDAYSTKDAATRINSVSITGLQNGERILAIDFRPATGQLYGLGSNNRLYVINQITGVARVIGTQAFTPAIVGGVAGFDFNPSVDRIRVVSSTGQNLRLNPETGATDATDEAINGAPGAMLTGVAYTNNISGASTTALYAINSLDKQLYIVNSPNSGTIAPIGALNLNISGDGGFDIDAKSGTALGLYAVNGQPTLFSVDLTSGAARPLAQYSASLGYSGLAIRTQPVAYAAANLCSTGSSCSSELLIFNPTDPSTFTNKPITGITDGELLKGLDFRPSTGQLYALGDLRGIYTINPATGAATLVSRLSMNLPSVVAGLDFDPVTDVLRYVAPNGINWRIDLAAGQAPRDAPFTPNSTLLNAAAYDNNFTGTSTTNLYVVDYGTDKLYLQSPPNAGTLREIGSLGINVGDDTHFDIGGLSNTAYLMHTPSGFSNVSRPGPSQLYTVNLATGAATLVGDFDFIRISDRGQYQLRGFTVGLGF
ncbi:DUF4394 domain-containing protein [Hymenobacter sp. HD11105]